MTLQEFFDTISQDPTGLLYYFLAIPAIALLIGSIDSDNGDQSPWKYIYAILIYLVSIPGIFAVTLSIYVHGFEGKSIMNIDMYTQVLPIISMIFTLIIISKNVPLDDIPGFDKISGFMFLIAALILLLWFIQKLHIFTFTNVPIQIFVIGFVALLLVFRSAISKIVS